MNEFFTIESKCRVVSFRLSEISSIETPGRNGKPCGWPDEHAAFVTLKNRQDCVALDSWQWEQLRAKLELANKPQSSGIEYL